MPAPPDGPRPGQVGLVCAGRVILGDVAVTLVDLAIRGHLDLALGQPPAGGGGGGWLLTPRPAAAPSQGAGALLGYERILLSGLAGSGGTVSLRAVPRAVLDQTRRELIHDAVRRGWFRGHPRHHATSMAAVAMAGRILEFRRDLLHPQRTAWLLTGDWDLAQDLVQTALAQVWPRWKPISRRDDPEMFVRRVMLNTWSTWRRRRWVGEHSSADVPVFDDLTEAQVAQVLG